MAKRKPAPVLTHTELLCLAYRSLEQDVRNWELAFAALPEGEHHLEDVCARQLAQMDAIRSMYLFETGTEM